MHMGGGGGGNWAKPFYCPYPLKVQACPPRDQRLATQSRVSWQDVLPITGPSI